MKIILLKGKIPIKGTSTQIYMFPCVNPDCCITCPRLADMDALAIGIARL